MQKSIAEGTMSARRHASLESAPPALNASYIRGMNNCVIPPPVFPHPPLIACAVPTTFEANMEDPQYCVQTKADPVTPMMRRMRMRLMGPLMSGQKAVVTAPQSMRAVWSLRGPYASHMGPTMNRAKMVMSTEVMFAVQIWASVRPRSALITGIKGARANQPRKARKKESHEMWNEVMCGRWQEKMSIFVARYPCSGSTSSRLENCKETSSCTGPAFTVVVSIALMSDFAA
mmetsp:Transcript_32090/g.54141  ORF Transcript_32090/g.54141 Transcript_32090/m.54141 type:complete len:231 (-) Transcript_32090:142-834(-)